MKITVTHTSDEENWGQYAGVHTKIKTLEGSKVD